MLCNSDAKLIKMFGIPYDLPNKLPNKFCITKAVRDGAVCRVGGVVPSADDGGQVH